MPAPALLEVEDLRVTFNTDDGVVRAVDGVSFNLGAGEVLAIVGESGSGKSATVMTLLGLTRVAGARVEGSARLLGQELLSATEAELRRVRGAQIGMVFQDPMSSLNPVQRVGDQIAEQIQAHDGSVTRAQARERTIALMERMAIPRARARVRSYPHEFSGGMRQRVMLAMALSCAPRVVIADEPTTALDVTIQAQILDQFRSVAGEGDTGIILVTHDLGVVADVADRVAVMYAGQVVERGTADELFYDPQHPYTWGLLGSITRVDRPRPERLSAIPGAPPSLLNPPGGCRFQPRCPHRFDRCATPPPLEPRVARSPGHADRCWLEQAEKRRLRTVDGVIGLAAEGTVIA
jgi:peptide/nickel transport system ATP-binding protein/oligopeptide transport system ATP-binding protein